VNQLHLPLESRDLLERRKEEVIESGDSGEPSSLAERKGERLLENKSVKGEGWGGPGEFCCLNNLENRKASPASFLNRGRREKGSGDPDFTSVQEASEGIMCKRISQSRTQLLYGGERKDIV